MRVLSTLAENVYVIKTKSALMGLAPVQTGQQLKMREVCHRSLWQVDAWASSEDRVREQLAELTGLRIPAGTGVSVVEGESRLLWAGPSRYWLSRAVDDADIASWGNQLDAEDGHLIDIGHSRTVLSLSGEAAQSVLQAGIAVDLHEAQFSVGSVLHSSLAIHTPISLHRLQEQHFELYVYRSYAQHTLEWLLAASQGQGIDWRPD